MSGPSSRKPSGSSSTNASPRNSSLSGPSIQHQQHQQHHQQYQQGAPPISSGYTFSQPSTPHHLAHLMHTNNQYNGNNDQMPSGDGGNRRESDSRLSSPGNSPHPGGRGSRGKSESGDADMKRRKVIRACDVCRRKKIKCDGPMNSNSKNKCAHCQEYNLDCTYVELAKRRGPPKGYIETLEQRCGRLERVLQQLHPGVDFTETVGPMPDREDFDIQSYQVSLLNLHIPPYPSIKHFVFPTPHASSTGESPMSAQHTPAAGLPNISVPGSLNVLGPLPWNSYEQDPNRPSSDDRHIHDHEDAKMHAEMAKELNKMDIKDASWRFHGKASLAHLLKLVNDIKYGQGPTFLECVNADKRNEYWQIPEWEVVIANEGLHPIDYSIWPPPDLATTLIDQYFDQVNFYIPLLNKIIFIRQYDAGLYKTNREFAKVCLMVFANGARFVDDERVYWPREVAMTEEGKERLRKDEDGTIKYSAGWHFLLMLLRMGRSIVQGPNLYEFQTQVLLCNFLTGSAVPHLTWLISGMGLRSAQEIGIHVRSTLLLANPVERALYNRAFWCLYHVDRQNCASIGRSVALQDTDFDADYPIPVDDEYWETGDPSTDFKQPEGAGVPKVAAFIHMLKLDHVIGAALRTLYAINRLPEHRSDAASQRAVVVELDSALNSWADAVPDGLRWDPTRADQQLFQQSAMLYSHYYLCQILIHRPFIPTPKHPETVGLPSLAICANASRSITNILDAVLRRGRQFGALPGQAMHVQFMVPAWTAAVILLVSVYSGKQLPSERDRAKADVQKCIAALKEVEVQWRQAGKLVDMLLELSSERPTTTNSTTIIPIPPNGSTSNSGIDNGAERSSEKRGYADILHNHAGSINTTGDLLSRIQTQHEPVFTPNSFPSQSQSQPSTSNPQAQGSGIDNINRQSISSSSSSSEKKRIDSPPRIFGLLNIPNKQDIPWLPSGPNASIDTSIPTSTMPQDNRSIDINNINNNNIGPGTGGFDWMNSDIWGIPVVPELGGNLGLSGGVGSLGGFGDFSTAGDDLWAQVFGGFSDQGMWTPGLNLPPPGVENLQQSSQQQQQHHQ